MAAAAAAAAPTKEMENLTIAAPVPKGTAKRDALRANEIAVQKKWEDMHAFEANPDPNVESFMVTFPYPYSNGHLHIGHAFSLTKAVFRAQFERHQGKNVLFPFAFHCTGMPIQAVSFTRLVF
jgi:leucyl-tRNA synthetase